MTTTTPSKILIVEDEILAAENIAKHLRKQGYEVSGIVPSGEEAIARSTELRPNLVLMDISLQGSIDGITAADRIGHQLQIPVVYLTAYTDSKTLDRAKSTNPYGYLVKPFKFENLRVSIEVALQKYRDEVVKEQRFAEQLEDSQAELNQLKRLQEEHRSIAEGLSQALKNQEFSLYYQPRVNLRTDRIVSAEALLRWHRPQHGTVLPATFIAISEANGLIDPIGEWVLRAACDQLQAFQESGLKNLSISVNLSGSQLKLPHLHVQVERILQDTQIDPRFIELELTESTLIEDMDWTVKQLHALKSLGVNVAIDDFGTGSSSMLLLHHFPFDTLKLARCFITNIDCSPKDITIASSIISLAHKLDIKVVAEGVETQAERDCLQQLGCDEIQGFLISPPIPAAQFLNQISS
ncbi:EAL domain-containing protein [Pseudanabaena sp. PCC 6802]|uniref:two-component system response regulator n=1 Tax=Pseudanabaena sp. PCC 6802 TaxID=118173 RepID=UPI00034C4B54|nr:EAL domain-containing protein [Pseudanabaena sp. PCC 6802]